MEFLKKHYEKLILVGLLIIFIFSMVYLLSAINDSEQISPASMNIPSRPADYVEANRAADEFNPEIYLSQGNTWAPSVERGNANKGYFSDLVWMFPAARCGNTICAKLIPQQIIIAGGDCPVCGFKLHVPTQNPDTKVVFDDIFKRLNDRDLDGIPNDVELAYGLNPDDPSDALQSLAKDGFSNLYKYRNGFTISDANSHPPLYMRFIVDRIGKVPLPFKLAAINTNNSEIPTDWDIQINDIETDMVYRNTLLRIGEQITIGTVRYTISDATYKPAGGANIKDESTVTLSDGKGGTMVMKMGEELSSPSDSVRLFDTGFGNYYTVEEGAPFRIGNERYIIKRIDIEKGEVYFANAVTQSEYSPPVTKDGPISRRMRVFNPSNNKSSN